MVTSTESPGLNEPDGITVEVIVALITVVSRVPIIGDARVVSDTTTSTGLNVYPSFDAVSV